MTDTDAAAKWLEANNDKYNKAVWERANGNDKPILSLLASYAAEVDAGKWVAINSENLPEPGSWAISQSKAGAIYPRFYSVEDKQYWLDNFIAYRRMPTSYVPAQQEEQV